MMQGYYDEDMDSDMTESQADEEVAVTKRGRAVKMPAKYKAEVSLCSTGVPGKWLLWHHCEKRRWVCLAVPLYCLVNC